MSGLFLTFTVSSALAYLPDWFGLQTVFFADAMGVMRGLDKVSGLN